MLRVFVNLLQVIHQLILSYQKPSYQRWYNQKDFPALSTLLGPLLKTGLPLIKSVIKPLAKSVLIPLRSTASPTAADAGIHEKILGSGHTTLIISNNEMKDIIKIVKYLDDSGLLLKGVIETVQNEVKEQKRGFLSMFLGTLGASLLGNLLTGKRIYRAEKGKGINRAVKKL